MKLFTLLLTALLAFDLSAQAPSLMSYQAVVRDGGNALVTNSPIGMRLSVRQGMANGTAVYVETHVPITNANGLATVQVGAGAVVSGSVAGIDWAAGPYFLQTETDPAGGTNYSISGTQQLLSVPYALYAANGGTQGPPGPPGEQGPPGAQGPSACDMVRTGDGRVVVYTGTNAYGFGVTSTGSSGWVSTAVNGAVVGALASDTIVVIYTTSNAYAFGPTSTGSSGWISTALDGAPLGAAASTGRIVVYTATSAYGAGRTSSGSTGWTSTSLSGTPLVALAAGNRVVVYTVSGAYGFGVTSSGSSGWISTTLSGDPQGIIGTR